MPPKGRERNEVEHERARGMIQDALRSLTTHEWPVTTPTRGQIHKEVEAVCERFGRPAPAESYINAQLEDLVKDDLVRSAGKDGKAKLYELVPADDADRKLLADAAAKQKELLASRDWTKDQLARPEIDEDPLFLRVRVSELREVLGALGVTEGT